MQLLEGRERVRESERGREVSFRDTINCTKKRSQPHQPKSNVQSERSAAPSFQRAADHDSDQFAGLFLAGFWLLTAANRGTDAPIFT